MAYKWILTNVYEEKSYVITNKTLVGQKEYCEIKLWGTDLTENDIRFKIREDKYVSMRIFRKDIKNINIKINHKPWKKIPFSIHLYNRTYFSIESYTFKLTKICEVENLTEKVIIKKLTEKIIQEFRNIKKNMKSERLTAMVKPNTQPLTGKYVEGTMIFPTPPVQRDIIDLTS